MITFIGVGVLFIQSNFSRLVALLLLLLGLSTLFWDNIVFFEKPRVVHKSARTPVLNLLLLLALFWYGQYFFNAGGLVLFLEDSETLRINLSAGKGEFILLSTAVLYVDIFYRRAMRIFAFTLFVLVYFILIIGIGWRSPGMYFLIWAFLTRASTERSNVNIKIRHGLIGVFLLLFSSYIGLIRAGIPVKKIGDLLWNIRHLFIVNISNLEKVVEYTDRTFYRLGWTYLNDLSVSLPGLGTKFTGVNMKAWTNSHFEGETMTLTLPGELYLNFGLFGLVILVLFFPMFIRLSESYLLASGKDIHAFLWVALAIFLFRISTGGIMPILIFQLIPLLLIYFLTKIRYAKNIG
ncbi:hypothetical protein N9H61_00015 [Schleiferiaceae bacterium]|nr:hypothetical protein [Schleiferiaceae bacterium]